MHFWVLRVTGGAVVTFFLCYELLVLEMCVGRWSGPPPSPPSSSILLPFLKLESGIPLYAKGGSLPVCLCQAQIWVTELLSSDASVSQTIRGEQKTLTVWMSVFVFALKYGLLFFFFNAPGCICVFDMELGRVGSDHAWIGPSCSPVFLHCPESTVICPL